MQRRLLWFLDIDWARATEADASALVGWLRTAPNPQRRRRNPNSPQPGSVNPRTGKPYLKAGYAPSTINHCLTVISGFYAYHRHYNRGPLINPVPESRAQRRDLAHRAPRTAKSRSSGGPDCASGSPRPIRARFRTGCGTSSSPP
ncbi:hypothetical protein ACFYYB_40820 [Streptomyces sp. NPDC002886]|uniref:hypothetical protein n=1 Tax=Streptomyces sp. NPDC002886 TaxID=3364667 RepID=UPI0036C4D028